MTKQEQVNADIVSAMKSKDKKVAVLRSLKSAFTNAALQSGNASNPLSDEAVIIIIRKQIKQREDSITQYEKANRQDLIDVEKYEISVLEGYLPQALTEDELTALIDQTIKEIGATTKKDMGKVIKRVVELAEGRVDNKTISSKVGVHFSI
jgi:uncharacterized protein YqeY